MTDLSELEDLVERSDLYYELDCIDLGVNAIEFRDGWSLRATGSRELAYLRKPDGWTREQITSVMLLLEAFEELFLERWEQTIGELDSSPSNDLATATTRT